MGQQSVKLVLISFRGGKEISKQHKYSTARAADADVAAAEMSRK